MSSLRVNLPAGVNAGDVPIWTTSGWAAQDERSGIGPEAWGLLEWNFPVDMAGSGILTSGTKYVLKIVPRITRTVTNIEIYVTAAGSTLTSGQNLAAFYNSSGTKLGSDTADQTTPWASTGRKTMAIGGGAQSVTAGSTYYVELISVGTTPPTIGKSASNVGAVNFGQAAASCWFATNGTGATATDSSFTPSSLTVTGATPAAFWVGLS